MSAANTEQTLNGHFKQIYASKIEDLRPSVVKMLKIIPFVESSKRNGDFYNQPIALGYEHGFSYGGSAGGAYSLDSAIAAAYQNTQIKGHSLVLRSFLSIDAASRSMNSEGAFVKETKYLVENMLKSFMVRLEVQMMYGQSGIGSVASIASAVISIDAHEWSPGIWAGAENMKIEIRNAAGTVSRGEATVVSTNFSDRSVTVDGVPAGTVATDVIFHKGANGKEFAGLHKITSNVSDSLFGVDASQFSLFRGNTVEVGTDATSGAAVISFDKVEEAIARMMEKGLSEDKVCLLVNPRSWKNLLTEQSAKREYDSSYSKDKMVKGAKEIEFAAQNGSVEVKSSIFVKEGYAYIFSASNFKRIGSSDITFDQPGLEGKFIKLLESVNAYEMRAYCDEALFTHAPGHTAFLKFIKS